MSRRSSASRPIKGVNGWGRRAAGCPPGMTAPASAAGASVVQLLVQGGRRRARLGVQLFGQDLAAGRILGQRRAALPGARQQPHGLLVGFLPPRLQRQLPEGVFQRRRIFGARRVVPGQAAQASRRRHDAAPRAGAAAIRQTPGTVRGGSCAKIAAVDAQRPARSVCGRWYRRQACGAGGRDTRRCSRRTWRHPVWNRRRIDRTVWGVTSSKPGTSSSWPRAWRNLNSACRGCGGPRRRKTRATTTRPTFRGERVSRLHRRRRPAGRGSFAVEAGDRRARRAAWNPPSRTSSRWVIAHLPCVADTPGNARQSRQKRVAEGCVYLLSPPLYTSWAAAATEAAGHKRFSNACFVQSCQWPGDAWAQTFFQRLFCTIPSMVRQGADRQAAGRHHQ